MFLTYPQESAPQAHHLLSFGISQLPTLHTQLLHHYNAIVTTATTTLTYQAPVSGVDTQTTVKQLHAAAQKILDHAVVINVLATRIQDTRHALERRTAVQGSASCAQSQLLEPSRNAELTSVEAQVVVKPTTIEAKSNFKLTSFGAANKLEPRREKVEREMEASSVRQVGSMKETSAHIVRSVEPKIVENITVRHIQQQSLGAVSSVASLDIEAILNDSYLVPSKASNVLAAVETSAPPFDLPPPT